MSQYLESYGGANDRCLAEAYYNIGRLFHLLGLTSLALKYYSKAFELSQKDGGNRDVAVISMANHALSLLTLGNKSSSLSLLKQNVIL
jgi:general transcription factor 3C polypeptide 3 (transcription factor C subunit 4)